MKFMDSMFDCKFSEGHGKPVFSSGRFWIRAFEIERKVVIVLSKVQK